MNRRQRYQLVPTKTPFSCNMSTTPVEKSPPVTNYEVDEEGDLVLRVGSETSTCDFLVCSSTLRRASLVWKKMLYGEFQEAKPAQGDWIVTLPDDDPSTMRVLLDIVHANFSDVPRQLDLPGVYTLLILMDKYDALRFVKPWARHWFSMIEAVATSTNGYHLCMAAYAALQMGAESDAYNLVSRISRNSTIDSAGKLAVHGVQLELCNMLDSVGPHSIFGTFASERILSYPDGFVHSNSACRYHTNYEESPAPTRRPRGLGGPQRKHQWRDSFQIPQPRRKFHVMRQFRFSRTVLVCGNGETRRPLPEVAVRDI